MDSEEPVAHDYMYDPDNITDPGFCAKETVAKVGSIAVPLFFSIVVLLSLAGNILVLVILGLYENFRSLTNIFIINLAVSDLMFTLGLPFWSSYFIWGWTFGDAVCKGVNFVFSAGYYSSIVFLMLMTIQRYAAVVHPMSKWEGGKQFAAVPILAWVVSISAAVPAVLLSKVMADPEDPNKLYCEYNSMKATVAVTYEQNIFFLSAFLVIGFCYIRILQTVLNSRARKRHRTIRLIFCIVAVFFIGWAPYNIVIFLQTLTYHQIDPFRECYVTDSLEYADYACRLLAFSHCCLNPVFYVFVSVKFQNYLKMIVQKLFHGQSNTDLHQPRNAPVPCSQGSMY
ncbi:chemokine XC receptor 1-like isoform X2 [Pygocentrus nattereri]|uniref:chemokine XC receptor 1-like isoform X2 n=1 Tax=Pygocentrus nattereri TaxID=42514 RepID=UPI0008145153|nr:chemokine XC receptor 1-like isoform X2 [Pygocentrus nattereri]